MFSILWIKLLTSSKLKALKIEVHVNKWILKTLNNFVACIKSVFVKVVKVGPVICCCNGKIQEFV